jgi:hypothetical protein
MAALLLLLTMPETLPAPERPVDLAAPILPAA